MNIFHVKKLEIRALGGTLAPGYILKPGALAQPAVQNFTTRSNAPTVKRSVLKKVSSNPSRGPQKSQTINLLNNYNNWAQSPVLNQIYNSPQIKLPFIHLKEYRLDGSTLWEQFKYFTFYRFFARVEDAAGDIIGSGTWLERTMKDLEKGAKDLYDSFAKWIEDKFPLTVPDPINATLKDPYEGLYSLTPTGFEYIFPFFSKEAFRKGSMYSETYSGESRRGQFIMEDLETIEGLASQHSQGFRAFAEPGLYIEKSQFYEFGENLEEIKFSFPLLNTQSQEQIDQNFQLIFLLVFQNSMYRKDRAAFIPPCIYEVLIPGIRYMKYAHVSSLEVDFLGTRRMEMVNTQSIKGPIRVKTIVPEAYNVTITIRGLHEETANFMFRSGANTFGDVRYLSNLEGKPRKNIA